MLEQSEVTSSPSVLTQDQTPTQSFWVQWRLKFLVAVLVIIGIVIVGIFLLPKGSSTSESVGTIPISPSVRLSPTPFPFQELTIPFLRQRTYSSTLGPLEKVSQNASYISYLTTYTSDGLKIYGQLTEPVGTMPIDGWPAIVFVHGYIPPAQYTTLERYGDYVDYLARNGFVVFKIDLRGHGKSEGEAGGGYYGSDYVIDTLNAYAALSNAEFVNHRKIGLWGHSMAGNVVLRSMAAHPSIPAGVIWAGAVYSYVDQQKYGISDASYTPLPTTSQGRSRRRELMEKYGNPSMDSFFWRQVAPTNYLSDLKGAIQLNHAVNDDVVNIGYSRDLNMLLDKTSVPHELKEYTDGGHNLSGSSFVQAMNNTVTFFKEHL